MKKRACKRETVQESPFFLPSPVVASLTELEKHRSSPVLDIHSHTTTCKQMALNALSQAAERQILEGPKNGINEGREQELIPEAEIREIVKEDFQARQQLSIRSHSIQGSQSPLEHPLRKEETYVDPFSLEKERARRIERDNANLQQRRDLSRERRRRYAEQRGEPFFSSDQDIFEQLKKRESERERDAQQHMRDLHVLAKSENDPNVSRQAYEALQKLSSPGEGQ